MDEIAKTYIALTKARNYLLNQTQSEVGIRRITEYIDHVAKYMKREIPEATTEQRLDLDQAIRALDRDVEGRVLEGQILRDAKAVYDLACGDVLRSIAPWPPKP
jgi:hypothetical protein